MAKPEANVLDQITTGEEVQQTPDGDKLTVSDIVGKETPATQPAEPKPEGIDSAVAAGKNAAAEVVETKTDKATDAVATEVDDDSVEAASAYRKMQEDWNKDESIVAIDIWKQMSPEAQDKFLKHLVGTDKTAGISKEYEPASDFEKALLPHVDDLVSVPERIGKVQESIESHAQFINSGLVYQQATVALFETFGKAFGVEVPKVDVNKALQAVQSGKGWDVAMKPYKQALDKMAEGMKQGLKPRPAGTSDESREMPTILASDSIATRLAKMKAGGVRIA